MITVLLATLPLVGSQLGKGTPAKFGNSDQQVIQQALLSFFHKEVWHSADWHPKQYVVLNPNYQSKRRISFNEAIRPVLLQLRQERAYLLSEQRKNQKDRRMSAAIMARETKRNKSDLEAVETSLSPRKFPLQYNYPPMTPLTSFRWDPRIKLTDRTGRPEYPKSENFDQTLEKWTIYARVQPPAYAMDGLYILVEFNIPWSMHSADVRFLFQRNGAGWRQVCVVPMFYV